MAMIQYNPVSGMFIPLGSDSPAAQALAAVRREVGEDTWKQGNTMKTPGGTTEKARKAILATGYKEPELTGELVGAAYAETSDSKGNVYKKARVTLKNGEERQTITLEMGREETQTLIQKLTQVQPGQVITIGVFQVAVTRGTRNFVNHKATVKSAGVEIPANGFWARAQEQANAKGEAVKALINDPKAINTAKSAAIVDFHVGLLKELEAKYASGTPEAPESDPGI